MKRRVEDQPDFLYALDNFENFIYSFKVNCLIPRIILRDLVYLFSNYQPQSWSIFWQLFQPQP